MGEYLKSEKSERFSNMFKSVDNVRLVDGKLKIQF